MPRLVDFADCLLATLQIFVVVAFGLPALLGVLVLIGIIAIYLCFKYLSVS